MAPKDFYKILGLSKDASENDIKKAYHQLAKKYHPDKNKAADAEERFKEIGAAYETLKDKEKRRVYDMQKEGEEEKARMHKQASQSNFSTFKDTSSSGTDKTFGFSTNRPRGFTFKTNFTPFDDQDDFFNRARAEFENVNPNDSPPKKGKKKTKASGAQRRSFNFTRPEWNNNWNEEERRSETPNFAFPNIFMDDPFSEFDRMFEEFFSDPFFTSPFGPSLRDFFTPWHRRTYQQHSTFAKTTRDQGKWDEGIFAEKPQQNIFTEKPQRKHQPTSNTRRKQEEEEEEMYDWSKPMFGFKSYDSDSEYDYFDLEDDHGQILLKCSYCGRKFRPTILKKHEQVCEKWQKRREKTPSSDDENNAFRFSDSPEPKRKDWYKQHDDLLNNVHNARKPKNTYTEPPYMSRSSSPEDEVYVECQWCHKQFSEAAARHHIPFCEKRTAQGSHTNRGARPASGKTYRAKQYTRTIPKPSTTRRSTEGLSSDRGSKPPPAPTPEHSVPHFSRPGSGHIPRRQTDRPDTPGHNTSRTARAGTPHDDGVMGTSRPSRSTTRPSRLYNHADPSELGRSEGKPSGQRNFMDEPFIFTASGLHAQPRGGSTRSRSSVRVGLGGTTKNNFNFSMPSDPKVFLRSRSSSAPNVRMSTQQCHQSRQMFSDIDQPPAYQNVIHIATATV